MKMLNRRNLAALAAFLMTAALSAVAVAQAPASLPVQGYLSDAEGAPLEGTAELVFTIYNASGDPLFTSTQTAALDNGAFSVMIGGSADPLDLSIFRDNSVLELGVAVDGGEELSPRFDIATSPFAGFAQFAGDAATLEGNAATDFARAGEIDYGDLLNVPADLDDGDDDTLAGLGCSANQVPQWDGSAWTCSTATDTLQGLGCSAGQVAKYNGASWACTGEFVSSSALATVATTGSFSDLTGIPSGLSDGDDDTTYSAGNGLSLSNQTFSIDPSALDSRFVNDGETNSISTAMIINGAVTRPKIADNSINSAKVADNTLGASDLATGSVGTDELQTGAVGTAQLQAGAVGTTELQAGAVTHPKINWNSSSNTTVVRYENCNAGLEVTRSFVPVDFCLDGVDLPGCFEIGPGAFCEHDTVSDGCTLSSTTGLDGGLNNCPGALDIYIRVD